MPGAITTNDISGSLDAKNIAMRVLQGAIELTDMAPMCMEVRVPELTATIPVQSVVAGAEDLGEFETSEIEGSEFTNIDFDLKKDRIKVAVSDEARYKSKAGDPLTLQERTGSSRLAQMLNKKIVDAFDTTPQTSAGSDWSGANNPLADIGTAIAAIRPFKPSHILMGTTAFTNYVANASIAKYGTGNVGQFNNAVAVVPGYNIPIYSSQEVDDQVDAAAAFVVARDAPGAVVGNGPVKVRRKDTFDGGEVYQIDVWRQVKSNIHDTGSDTNKAVYKLTALNG
jgi:hypothetical protein